MLEIKNCQHLFSDCSENYAFTTDDGIEVFVSGAEFQKCMSCGHTEFPFETKELIETTLKERRKISQPSTQMYINLLDLI